MTDQLPIDSKDVDLLMELNRAGMATKDEIVFATGNFSGDVDHRLCRLIDLRAVAFVSGGPKLNFCCTGTGLEAVFLSDAVWRSCSAIYRHRLVASPFAPLVQLHSLRVPVRAGR